MRMLIIQVPQGEGSAVLNAVQQHKGTNSSSSEALNMAGEPVDQIIVQLPNNQVGPFMASLDPLPDVHAALLPSGMLTFRPPAEEIADQAVDVSPRSPFEIFVSGLQSIGSWKGFLSYAGIAGIVVWLGLFTNSTYLLVAAMLIAPFTGPAMNAAIATARGDLSLLWRSVLRYFAALGVTIVTTGVLSLVFRQDVATQTMSDIANISATAVLLPLAAGAAGALNLSQSERSSLVPGAAAGMLVAASLAPPAGLIGMGAVISEWDMVINGLFLLGLQLVAINLSGAVVFRMFGVQTEGPRLARGRTAVTWAAGAVAFSALALLMLVQFGSGAPNFQRSTIEQRARSSVLSTINTYPDAHPVSVTVRFTRADIEDQNTLLVEIYVQRPEGTQASAEDVRQDITNQVQRAILEQDFNITPLVAVTVVDLPGQ